MKITWLADVLRAAGLEVVEHSGWKIHAVDGDWEPRYGVVHATAAPRSQADSVQVRVVRDGREGLRGPIANACVTRDAAWHVVSAGRCNTTITGTAGPYRGLGNTYALGVEGCNDNADEAWPDDQYRSYVLGWAAICRRLGWTQDHLVGHKEHTPGHKTDPTFNMSRFRGDVAAALNGEDDDMPSAEEYAKAVWKHLLTDPRTGKPKEAEDFLRYNDVASVAGAAEALKPLATVVAELAKTDHVDEQALAAALAPLILAGLPDDDDEPVSVDTLVEAFRRLLGAPTA